MASPGGSIALSCHCSSRWVLVNDPDFSVMAAAGNTNTSVPMSSLRSSPLSISGASRQNSAVSMSARIGDPNYAIGENKYLTANASSVSYEVTITLNDHASGIPVDGYAVRVKDTVAEGERPDLNQVRDTLLAAGAKTVVVDVTVERARRQKVDATLDDLDAFVRSVLERLAA